MFQPLSSAFSQTSLSTDEVKKSIEESLITALGDIKKLGEEKLNYIKKNAATITALSLPKIAWTEKSLTELGKYFPFLKSLSLLGGSFEDRYVFVPKKGDECPFGIISGLKKVILEHSFGNRNIEIEETLEIKTYTDISAYPRDYSGISKEAGKPVHRKLFA
jgi:hypothetical protein